jgi:pyoverdine/dityrosine biosynthesis protein Dit1
MAADLGAGLMATDGNKTRPGKKRTTASDGRIVDSKVVRLGRDVQAKIGQHLRTMYDEVVKQGVPDHLNEMLRKLDNSDESEKSRN